MREDDTLPSRQIAESQGTRSRQRSSNLSVDIRHTSASGVCDVHHKAGVKSRGPSGKMDIRLKKCQTVNPKPTDS